jgi:exodeoxyribonuclease-3
MRRLAAWAAGLQARGRELVLCGDINITRTDMDVHPRERRPVIGQLPEERQLFAALLENLVDVGRQLDPDNPGLFTWWAPWRNMRQRNIGWRLDYILASPSLAARATSCAVLAEVGTSDHAPVMTTIAEPPAAPAPRAG